MTLKPIVENAAADVSGRKPRDMRLTAVNVPNVKSIRQSLQMSQQRFAQAFRIPLATVKNWEQGRRHPDAPAAAYLLAIKRMPKKIMAAMTEQ